MKMMYPLIMKVFFKIIIGDVTLSVVEKMLYTWCMVSLHCKLYSPKDDPNLNQLFDDH